MLISEASLTFRKTNCPKWLRLNQHNRGTDSRDKQSAKSVEFDEGNFVEEYAVVIIVSGQMQNAGDTQLGPNHKQLVCHLTRQAKRYRYMQRMSHSLCQNTDLP